MVITETGAGTAVAKALPSLEETNFECDSCSVPNGSLVVLNLEVSKETSIDEERHHEKYALEGELVNKLNIRRITNGFF
jgi:glyceraldehyde 3-phosphate dehydrogenase